MSNVNIINLKEEDMAAEQPKTETNVVEIDVKKSLMDRVRAHQTTIVGVAGVVLGTVVTALVSSKVNSAKQAKSRKQIVVEVPVEESVSDEVA